MWLSLQHKTSGDNLIVCVCYLPPLNSSRHVDAQNFFDGLMTDIFRYQNKDKCLYVETLIAVVYEAPFYYKISIFDITNSIL